MASAFLAGDWEPAAMRHRAREALGLPVSGRQQWLVALVREISWVESLNPTRGARLLGLFQAVRWE